MFTCPTCATELDETNPVFDFTKLRDWIGSKWSQFESTRYSVGSTVNVPGVNSVVAIAASKTEYDKGDIDNDYYGELPQGTEFETYIVFQVGDKFYKKTGTGDSYGEISWDGDFKLVTPKEKTVVVYE